MKRLPSILGTTPWLGIVVRAACAWGLIGLACGSAAAAAAPIYKCLDRQLGLVYTDIPCKDGELMDVRAGDADPAALARLERERDALAQSSAQRISDLRRAELQRLYVTGPDYGPGYDAGPYADASDNSSFGFGFVGGTPTGRPHPRAAKADRRSPRQTVVPDRIPSLVR